MNRSYMLLCLVCLPIGLIAGCGGSAEAPKTVAENSASKQPETSNRPATPPAVSINASSTEPTLTGTVPATVAAEADGEAAQLGKAPKGTPERLLQDITELKLAPLPKTDAVEKLRAHRRERNTKIIEMSEKALAQTHQDKDREQLFLAAVRHLLDARYELALQGAAEDIDALFIDAEALIKRDKDSKAANIASFTLVNLAYNLAKRPQTVDNSWVKEFATQATFFGTTYPEEVVRGPSMLFNAGRSCELHGLTAEAITCYSSLQTTFTKSALAAQTTGILRRLKLTGGPAQISGPTLSGKNFSSDELLGKPILVVFWASVAKPFQQQLPRITAAINKHSASGLTVVGVNLDSETEAVQDFTAKYKIAWPQIIFPEEERRGWNHPLAVYYGVVEIPAYWLIDRNGVVASTTVTAENLDSKLTEVLSRVAPAQNTAARE